MTAAVLAAACMTWAWVLQARNLDRRDREQGGKDMEAGSHDRIRS